MAHTQSCTDDVYVSVARKPEAMTMTEQDFLSSIEISQDALGPELIPFVGYLLTKAAQQTTSTLNRIMKPYGLTSRHYAILVMLLYQENLQQAVIGNALRIDRTTMVRLVDELHDRALVLRERDPGDRRAYAISITPRGKETLIQISNKVNDAGLGHKGKLTEDEMRALYGLLKKLV